MDTGCVVHFHWFSREMREKLWEMFYGDADFRFSAMNIYISSVMLYYQEEDKPDIRRLINKTECDIAMYLFNRRNDYGRYIRYIDGNLVEDSYPDYSELFQLYRLAESFPQLQQPRRGTLSDLEFA